MIAALERCYREIRGVVAKDRGPGASSMPLPTAMSRNPSIFVQNDSNLNLNAHGERSVVWRMHRLFKILQYFYTVYYIPHKNRNDNKLFQ
jgi:hypothetical protein